MTEQTETLSVQAAYRDASWHRRPDIRSVKRAHVLRADGRAACGLVAVMCDSEPAELIPGPLRCQRAGCRDQWPAAQPEDAWHNA